MTDEVLTDAEIAEITELLEFDDGISEEMTPETIRRLLATLSARTKERDEALAERKAATIQQFEQWIETLSEKEIRSRAIASAKASRARALAAESTVEARTKERDEYITLWADRLFELDALKSTVARLTENQRTPGMEEWCTHCSEPARCCPPIHPCLIEGCPINAALRSLTPPEGDLK